MPHNPYDDDHLSPQQTYWDTEVTSYRRRRHGSFIWPMTLALVGVGLLLGAAWYFYGGTRKTEIALRDGLMLIEPSAPLLKYKPENPGGAQILHQDRLIYNTLDGSPMTGLGAEYQADMLQQDPEPPMDVNKKLGLAPRMKEEARVMAQTVTHSAEKMAKKILLEDLERAEKDLQPFLEKPVAQPIAHTPPPPRSKTAALVKEEIIVVTPLVDEEILRIKPARPPASVPTHPVYTVQTSSMYTQKAAMKEWALQRAEHPKLLGTLPHAVCPHNMKGFGLLHKLYVGAFHSPKEAQAFCEIIKEKNIDCFAHDVPINLSTCTFVP